MENLFKFKSYAAYLTAVFSNPKAIVRRRDLCQFLSCQPSFLSQVLSGKSQLSLEHALQVSQFLKHTIDERDYFLILVQRAKAGTAALISYFDEQIDKVTEKRQPLQDFLQVRDQLTAEDQAFYYNQWWYAAIHILTALPDVETGEDICRRLRLDTRLVREALGFLIERGLVIERKGKLSIGKTRVHLGSKSNLVARHHMNWRQKSIEMLERPNDDNLHYSAVIGISRRGAEHIRSEIMSLLKASEEVIETTKEEAPYILIADFFELT